MVKTVETERVLLRKKDVMKMTGLSPVTIWRYVRAKNFPQPVRLSANRSAFFADEVAAWLEAKRKERA